MPTAIRSPSRSTKRKTIRWKRRRPRAASAARAAPNRRRRRSAMRDDDIDEVHAAVLEWSVSRRTRRTVAPPIASSASTIPTWPSSRPTSSPHSIPTGCALRDRRGARPLRAVRRRLPAATGRGDSLRALGARQAAAAAAGADGGRGLRRLDRRLRCRPPVPSKWSTPIRSCTTTCRRWTMTTCAAAGRRATRCSAKRWRSLSATRCWPARSKCWRPTSSRPTLPRSAVPCLGHAAGATALVGGQAADLQCAERQ